MMFSRVEVEAAAKKLSAAQRELILGCRPDGWTRHPSWGGPRKALNARGIMRGFQLTAFGCQIRNFLDADLPEQETSNA